MLMTVAMLGLLIGLYVSCLALVRFVDGVTRPRDGS